MCALNKPGPHLPPALKSWSHQKREVTRTIPLSSAASLLQALSSLHSWLLQRETVITTWGFRTTLLLWAELCPPPPNHLLSPDPKYGFPGGSMVKNPSTNAEDAASILGWEDPLEKEMASHSSILAWEIPWTSQWSTVHGVTKSQARLKRLNNNTTVCRMWGCVLFGDKAFERKRKVKWGQMSGP